MRRFSYTYQDMADASGRSVEAVRVDVARGAVDAGDLRGVGLYITRWLLVGLDNEGEKR